MVCLGNKQRSFCHFWDCIQVLHFRFFCWLCGLLHFFWGIPAHSSRYNGYLSYSPTPVHFSLLIYVHSYHLLFDHYQFTLIHRPNIPGSNAIFLFIASNFYFHHQSHPQLSTVFTLAPSLHSFWSYFSTLLQWHIGHLPTWGVHPSVSYLFLPSHTVHGVLKARILK